MRRSTITILLGLALGAIAAPALAQGKLTLYCSSDEAWCQQAKREFEKKTGISVDLTRKSSGETYAQVKAEASNPKGDIWWGGTGDPHLQAAEQGGGLTGAGERARQPDRAAEFGGRAQGAEFRDAFGRQRDVGPALNAALAVPGGRAVADEGEDRHALARCRMSPSRAAA
jgi:hypothetical protein